MVGKMTREEFNMVFKLLCTNYPNTKNQEEVSDLYFMALEYELTRKEFLAVALKIIKTSKKAFMPQIAEILEIAKKTVDIEKQTFLAKKMLKTAISRHGSSGMICFEDKGIHSIIDYIGWNRFCMMTNEEFENFLNFQFDGIYKGFLENPYETSDYYIGTNKLFGQTQPTLVTYASIGVNNSEQMKFIPLEYKSVENKKITGVEKLKKKMLIGG